MTTRRDFLRSSAAAGAALIGCRSLPGALDGPAPARRSLDLLVLGGTGFIGPHLVRHAVARGHNVSIFTRGRRDAELPPSVTRLTGDRNGQLQALAGKKWDAVFDDNATNPEWVRQTTELMRSDVGRYVFTSSTGVYYPYLQRGATEATPVRTEPVDPRDPSETYGVNKARCERQVMQVFGDRGTVVRPTYIVGPGDTSDRFPYWPVRLAKGGEVLAPGRRDDPIQLVDVRDLAAFMLKLVEDGRGGIYNVAGPREVTTMPQFLERARDALRADVTFTWVDDYAFLKAQKIEAAVPWVMLEGKDYGHMSSVNAKALAAGLAFRPLATTVRDTLAWWPSVPEARRTNPRFAITPQQERAALLAWKQRRG